MQEISLPVMEIVETYDQQDYLSNDPSYKMIQSICNLLIEANTSGPAGHFLVFLPGAAEIEQLHDVLIVKSELDNVKIFPAYSMLPDKEINAALNQKVLDAGDRTRSIILATDIFEASVTIPGVVFVVDSGLQKRMLMMDDGMSQKLVIQTASHSALMQRRGRTGRTNPGRVHRMFTYSTMLKIKEAVRPPSALERGPIFRLVLELLDFKLPPEIVLHQHHQRVLSAISYLQEQKLVNEQRQLSPDALFLVSLPISMQLGLVVKRAHDISNTPIAMFGAVMLVAIIESVDSGSLFFYPRKLRGETTKEHNTRMENLTKQLFSQFLGKSDLSSLLNVFIDSLVRCHEMIENSKWRRRKILAQWSNRFGLNHKKLMAVHSMHRRLKSLISSNELLESKLVQFTSMEEELILLPRHKRLEWTEMVIVELTDILKEIYHNNTFIPNGKGKWLDRDGSLLYRLGASITIPPNAPVVLALSRVHFERKRLSGVLRNVLVLEESDRFVIEHKSKRVKNQEEPEDDDADDEISFHMYPMSEGVNSIKITQPTSANLPQTDVNELAQHVENNNLNEVEAMLTAEPQLINLRSQEGDSPIFYVNNSIEMLRLLIKHKANVNLENESGENSLSCASDPYILRALLKLHADPNKRSKDGYTPLLDAIESRRLGCVEMLLKGRADVNLKTSQGSPLEMAREHFPRVMATLLEYQQSSNSVNNLLMTASPLMDMDIEVFKEDRIKQTKRGGLNTICEEEEEILEEEEDEKNELNPINVTEKESSQVAEKEAEEEVLIAKPLQAVQENDLKQHVAKSSEKELKDISCFPECLPNKNISGKAVSVEAEWNEVNEETYESNEPDNEQWMDESDKLFDTLPGKVQETLLDQDSDFFIRPKTLKHILTVVNYQNAQEFLALLSRARSEYQNKWNYSQFIKWFVLKLKTMGSTGNRPQSKSWNEIESGGALSQSDHVDHTEKQLGIRRDPPRTISRSWNEINTSDDNIPLKRFNNRGPRRSTSKSWNELKTKPKNIPPVQFHIQGPPRTTSKPWNDTANIQTPVNASTIQPQSVNGSNLYAQVENGPIRQTSKSWDDIKQKNTNYTNYLSQHLGGLCARMNSSELTEPQAVRELMKEAGITKAKAVHVISNIYKGTLKTREDYVTPQDNQQPENLNTASFNSENIPESVEEKIHKLLKTPIDSTGERI